MWMLFSFFFFKQKTAYEVRISDWSSDVCSSDLGGLQRLLPEWEPIRTLPHASAIHRFTVDRHVVETCIEAGALIRRVARPDVLLVAALLHDIGKAIGRASGRERVCQYV